MGVDRTDYLMFATDVGPAAFDQDRFEAEICGSPGRRFDIVRDGMCGKYVVAGKIIAASDPSEGFEMVKVNPSDLKLDPDVVAAVSEAFGCKLVQGDFSLILFSHFS